MLESRFSGAAQFACVAAYFGTDLFLRFAYQAVLDGPPEIMATDKGDEVYVVQSYSKPTLLVLCCYMPFFLWGPLLVFPYLAFVRRISVVEYYNTEWCGNLNFREAVRYVCIMGCILFIGNVGYVAGLRYIDVALGSALSQGEAPDTVALSVLFLNRVFQRNEKIGILLSFLGIAFIAIPPVLRAKSSAYGSSEEYQYDDDVSNGALAQVSGILSTLFGAFGFGCYQVFWPFFDGKRYSPSNPAPVNPMDAIIDTFATLTIVGAFLLSCGWILILFLHVVGWETFEVPPDNIRGALAMASFLSATVDALNAAACVVATPVVVALAYPLIIPISVVMQYFIDGISISSWGVLGWIGTILVVAGVFCLEANGGGHQEEKGKAAIEHIDVGEEPTNYEAVDEDFLTQKNGSSQHKIPNSAVVC